MKQTTILLAVLFIALACGKAEKKPLFGEWRWISTSGGFAGVHETPASTGDERSTTFNKKSVTFYLNGEESRSFNYEVSKDVETNFGVSDVITKGGETEYLFSFSGDTLTLSEAYADGFTYRYVKE